MVISIGDIRIDETLQKIGSFYSSSTSQIIKSISSYGISITDTQGKIIAIVIALSLALVIFKVFAGMQKITKYLLIVALILLAVSVIFTFITP